MGLGTGMQSKQWGLTLWVCDKETGIHSESAWKPLCMMAGWLRVDFDLSTLDASFSLLSADKATAGSSPASQSHWEPVLPSSSQERESYWANLGEGPP